MGLSVMAVVIEGRDKSISIRALLDILQGKLYCVHFCASLLHCSVIYIKAKAPYIHNTILSVYFSNIVNIKFLRMSSNERLVQNVQRRKVQHLSLSSAC